mmetsp:Transcript_106927/g.190077  ORF Transcript_106927/g.190077 Transcript_106927/m.190077 type:complete len:403 (-) Transcript_106927:59-1267(-)|eukprot:CAMPEP_0197628384 /NCGR_PEP_ID=MMETSP1338-20131121/6719_1 /TAXON_ID=43686 ORGANISM="Pelagodinium beii, Strain RCC1491" /NCGR_SAMPLE_ID=MMETSP1338 /ASSEMBLY_ACC=CAM_ASM_000754 /LENGTH=402 /DNA_ID=CAMNT_0043199349 /DNA_START=100 /DNA_END=1308 /DNA_ORIENTATION=+
MSLKPASPLAPQALNGESSPGILSPSIRSPTMPGSRNSSRSNLQVYFQDVPNDVDVMPTLGRVRRPSREKISELVDITDVEAVVVADAISNGTATSTIDLFNLDEIRSVTSVKTSHGRLFEKYTLVKVLGEGAYGMVTEVQKKGSNETYATKTLGQDEEIEIKILRQMNHPHVIRLHEAIRDGDQLCLIMDLCDGDLDGWIESKKDNAWKVYGKVESSDVGRFSVQMLSAMTYIHYHHIAHRDVKPGNFLLQSARGKTDLMLTDFNLAHIFKDGEHMTDDCGSLNYTAPEVLCKDYTELCDVWSTGMVIYSLVCGRVVWPSDWGEEETMAMIRKGEVDLQKASRLNDFDAGCKDLLKKLLVLEDAGRPTAKEALKHKWLKAYVNPVEQSKDQAASQGCCTIS